MVIAKILMYGTVWNGIPHTGNHKGDCIGRRELMKLTRDPIWGTIYYGKVAYPIWDPV